MKFYKYWFYALAPLIGVLFAAAMSREFVWHAISTNTVLNGLIIGTALFTVYLNVRVLINVQREYKIVRQFEDSPNDVELLLDENDKTVRKILVAEMLHYVVKLKGRVKSRFDQAKIEQEYEFVRESLESQLSLPSYLAGLMVGLGLFGTFVGLLITLVGVGDLIGTFGSIGASAGDDIFSQLVGGLQKPIASMGIAFSSSLFGLTGSIVLGFVTLAVRSASAALVDELRFTLAGVVSLGRSKRVGQSGKGDDDGFAPSIFGEIGASGALAAAPDGGGYQASQFDAMSSEFMPLPDEAMPAGDLGPMGPGAFAGSMGGAQVVPS